MKDRLCKMSKSVLAALCLLATCGLTYSCSDDYDLDETTPPGMGPSIYDFLNRQKNYTNTVKLIDDLGYKEVLQRTGSKTLFVANDDAFEKFYQNNSWGVHNYNELTRSQKNLLLGSSMLDNAYLLEMMGNTSNTNTSSTSNATDFNKNTQLRQVTSASVTDSIPFFLWDSGDIPHDLDEGNGDQFVDYWQRFRTQEKGGILLALDGTTPMMTHFLPGLLGETSITDRDFEVITGSTREKTDAHVYASKVIDQDHTCLNGYVDELDRVLVTPQNMAEVIRTNGKTNIFSHMLDRFSAPFYNSSLTYSYRQLTGSQTDSVFEKRYFSRYSREGATGLTTDPNGNPFGNPLAYDPGWNQYYPNGKQRETDMGAIFVPSDEVLKEYFSPTGGGSFLMESYATLPQTEENLLHNIDQIPINIIAEFVKNLMKESFVNTVPSKYISIMNDAKDPMFSNIAGGVEGFIGIIDTCLLANNGAVYVLNEVYAPAAYAAISAPALVNNNMRIFNWAIHADDGYIDNSNNAVFNGWYSFYMLAMSSRFSFFVPSDDALSRYYDVVSSQWQQPRALSFYYSTRRQDQSDPVKARAYRWDPATMEVTTQIPGTINSTVIYNRLKDMMDSHLVVHTGDDASEGFGSGNEYYVTRGGSAIRISNMTDQNTPGFQVQGGFQIDHDSVCNVLRTFDRRQETTGYGNGMTYLIDRPIQTTTKSVYSVMSDEGENSPFYQFFQLCQVNSDLLDRAGMGDSVDADEKDNELLKYTIFTSTENGLTDNVRFFNTYRYTVYIPTNDAILDAINRGLPTWAEIEQVVDDGEAAVARATEEGQSEEDILNITRNYKTKARAMVTCLLNFLKYHFQDNSVFADKNAIEATDYETSSLNNETNRYRSVQVSSTGNGTLSVRSVFGQDNNGSDVVGPQRHVVDGYKNILTRDYVLTARATAGTSSTNITTSSYAVVHLIDGVLDFKQFANDRYDSDWQTLAGARRFYQKYHLKK